MATPLDQAEHEEILRFLNEVAPDTYDEGEDGPHKFTMVGRDGDRWVVDFEHDQGEDRVEFSFHDSFLIDDGPNQAWLDAFNAAYYARDDQDEHV